MLVTLKLDDGIDDMLQNFRACQRTFLGDVTNEDDGDSAGLGKAEQSRCTLTNLGDAAGRALYVFRRYGLYGVDDDNLGLYLLDVVEDFFEGVGTEYEEIIISG